MIKSNDSRWKSELMTAKESFDTFYRRKLDVLNVELKNVIKDGIPFVVSQEYACLVCQKRLKLHRDGLIYCLGCAMPPWSKPVRNAVQSILEGYPNLEECAKEWESAGHKNPAPPRIPQIRQCDRELGKQIKEARLKAGMTTHELAAKITKVKGGRLTERSVRVYESGSSRPSKNVLEQLKDILGLEVTENEVG